MIRSNKFVPENQAEKKVVKKAKQHLKCWKLIKNQAKEFCLATGLHGYKYIAQAQRSTWERIIWTVIVIASLCWTVVLMIDVWNYYLMHPTMTVIESTHHGIWNYPFPAVTLCNINRVSLNLTKHFVDQLNIESNVSKEFLVNEIRLLNELLTPGSSQGDVRNNLTQLQDIFDKNGLSISEVIQSVTQNCTSLIKACKWKGNIVDCQSIFKSSLSQHGLCCSFNYITNHENNQQKEEVEPKRIAACGYETALAILINPEPKDYHATIFGSYGVKLMLHDPTEYPDVNAENKLIGLGAQVFLSVAPIEIHSTNEVRDLPIATRKCIFQDEADYISQGDLGSENLTYSYLNCMARCRATIIETKCGCVPYYMPQNGSRICNLRDVECLIKYKSWYQTSWPGLKITTFKTLDSSERPCGCMPDCGRYSYPVEISQGVLNPQVYYKDFAFTKTPTRGIALENHSMVHIFFDDLVSIQYRRNVHYNWRNLFASLGGLLGLFVGFSFMSAFELLYFFLIRVISDIWMKHREYKSRRDKENKVRY